MEKVQSLLSAVDETQLAEERRRTLTAMESALGAFVVFMLVLAVVGYLLGEGQASDPIALTAFLVINGIIGRLSLRSSASLRLEVLRVVVGGATAVGAYCFIRGPLSPWWPGFLFMSLEGSIILGLIQQRPLWGRLLVLYYALLLVVMALLSPVRMSWQQIVLCSGVVLVLGFLFMEVISLLGETLEKERIRTAELRDAHDALFAEVAVAQGLQKLLLPHRPSLPGCKVSGRMISATEVGGDYFDVITAGKRHFLAIGDVSGHGLTSGLTMMMARSSLVGTLEAKPDQTLPEIYRLLNRTVRKNLERLNARMYMTLVLVEMLGGGRFQAVGRHIPLLVRRAQTGAIEEFEATGVWLGLFDDIEIELLPTLSFQLERGDLLVLYTDGVTERFVGGQMYGVERLQVAMARCAERGPIDFIDMVFGGIEQDSAEREDDMTLLALRYDGE
ncbi:MAG TPA: PP2C family protein-serine/threonine phosphatase [Polyangia bacterium]|nr:PP2C family protein-serine/threonine phosphatase [Polyangia bacterium]